MVGVLPAPIPGNRGKHDNRRCRNNGVRELPGGSPHYPAEFAWSRGVYPNSSGRICPRCRNTTRLAHLVSNRPMGVAFADVRLLSDPVDRTRKEPVGIERIIYAKRGRRRITADSDNVPDSCSLLVLAGHDLGAPTVH